MKWFFSPQIPSQVETEVTQRDRFSNDEVQLSETIVRESIQNSLDAADNEHSQVSVVFRWVDKSQGLLSEYCTLEPAYIFIRSICFLSQEKLKTHFKI